MKGKKLAAVVLSAALVFSGSGTALAAQTDEAQAYDAGQAVRKLPIRV